jgi:hypothetical protein
MKHHVLDKTITRSVVGVMNEFAFWPSTTGRDKPPSTWKPKPSTWPARRAAGSTRPTSRLTGRWRRL